MNKTEPHAKAASAPAVAAAIDSLPVDTEGTIVPPETAGTPVEGYRWMFQEVKDKWTLDGLQKNNLAVNDIQNMEDTITVDANRFDPAWFTPGIKANADKDPNGNYEKYSDVLVCRGTHRDLPPFTLADMPAAIAYWAGTGVWPKIEHGIGNVGAHA